MTLNICNWSLNRICFFCRTSLTNTTQWKWRRRQRPTPWRPHLWADPRHGSCCDRIASKRSYQRPIKEKAFILIVNYSYFNLIICGTTTFIYFAAIRNSFRAVYSSIDQEMVHEMNYQHSRRIICDIFHAVCRCARRCWRGGMRRGNFIQPRTAALVCRTVAK